MLRIPKSVEKFVDELLAEGSPHEPLGEASRDIVVHFYVDDPPSERPLLETKTVALGGPYSAQKHPPHVLPGDYHLHVCVHGAELFAINRDGTAHDRSHGVRIPNRAADGIRRLFPGFRLPPNNIIEGLTTGPAELLEAFFREREAAGSGT